MLPPVLLRVSRALTNPLLCRQTGWDIDCVVPVPDGSRPAAIQMSAELGLPYREGLVKNRYVGRTFIMPDQRCASERVSHEQFNSALSLQQPQKDVHPDAASFCTEVPAA